jgi:hypothetical protein
MFRAILYTQWKWSRLPLLPAVVVAFTLPLLSVQSAAGDPNLAFPGGVLASVRAWSIWFPVLAAGLGLLLATTAWGADHRGGHVYALSLPVARGRFVLMRFAAGMLLLATALVAFWVGSLVASALASLPPGLRSYPDALALRFAMAAAVAYAGFFAISSGTARTAGYVLAVVGGIVAVHVLLWAGGLEVNLLGWLYNQIVNPSGPLHVFTGRWMLIDV